MTIIHTVPDICTDSDNDWRSPHHVLIKMSVIIGICLSVFGFSIIFQEKESKSTASLNTNLFVKTPGSSNPIVEQTVIVHEEVDDSKIFASDLIKHRHKIYKDYSDKKITSINKFDLLTELDQYIDDKKIYFKGELSDITIDHKYITISIKVDDYNIECMQPRSETKKFKSMKPKRKMQGFGTAGMLFISSIYLIDCVFDD